MEKDFEFRPSKFFNEKMNESFSKLSAEFNAISTFFYDSPSLGVIADKHNILKINKRWFDIFGIIQADIEKNGWEFYIHPDDLHETTRSFERHDDDVIINRYRNSNGEYIWVFWNLTFASKHGLYISSGIPMTTKYLGLQKFLDDLANIRREANAPRI